MPKQITTKKYKERLIQRFGICTVLEEYKGSGVAIKHKCTDCLKPFLITPILMLHRKTRTTCTVCSNKDNGVKQTTPRADFVQRLKNIHAGVRCIKYTAMTKSSKFKCQCGTSWQAKPADVLNNKYACPSCCKKLKDTNRLPYKEVVARLAVKGFELTAARKFSTSYRNRLDVRCLKCKYEWSAPAGSMLQVGDERGCPQCLTIRTKEIFTSDKTVILGKRRVIVQGYEPAALKFLTKRFSANNIKVSSEGIPSIPYEFGGIERTYFPDILVGANTLVEVKSSYTLTVELNKNKAKAKACIKQGFKFKLIVVSPLGKCVVMPTEWVSWDEKRILEYISSALLGTIRILSMDPGTANFAWSVLEVSKPYCVKVIASGMIHNTAKTLVGFGVGQDMQDFLHEIEEIIVEFGVSHLAMERYMSRGMKGVTIELVNFMIGGVASLYSKRPIKGVALVTAAQWKNEYNRYNSLEEAYSSAKCANHQVDSTLIGAYYAFMLYGLKPFSIDCAGLVKQLNAVLTKRK